MIAGTPEQRQSFELRFGDFACRWRELTRYRSNLGSLRLHPIYQEVIALGESAVPLILRELEREASVSWFGPLTAITGESPVPSELAGHVAAMAGAWLEWGRQRGLPQ